MMTINQIRKEAPEGATHYAIESDESGDHVVYFTARSWGYCYVKSELLVDEYEIRLLSIKPL